MSNISATTTTRCYILELPAELRLMIWEYHMPSIDLPWWRNSRHNKQAGPIADRMPYRLPALLQTCKTLRYDAWDLFIKCLRDHQEQVQSTVNFIDGMRPHRVKFDRIKMQLVVTKNEVTKAKKERNRMQA